MAVNRPRSLSRQNTPHALTLPISTNINHSSTTSSSSSPSTTAFNNNNNNAAAAAAGLCNLSSYLPSTDESLQDWLARNIPETITNSPSPLCSLMNASCPCCEKYDCVSMEPLYKTIKKLESDACLAAQIGQSLLQKHESLVIETNKTKDGLEQQLDEFREKVANLEMLLIDADTSKQETEQEKDRFYYKWQKAQKALEDTSIDLEKANQRCIDIGHELQNKTKELEKLRIYKFMVRQADFREEMLQSQLEDTNQELAVSRKNELTLESKYKKLKSRYETVCTTCEKLRLGEQLPMTNNGNNRRMDYLLESNEQLQNDIIKLTHMLSGSSSSLSSSPSTEQDYLITLIKELTLANAKLKMELLEGNLLSLEDNPMSVEDNTPAAQPDTPAYEYSSFFKQGDLHSASTSSPTEDTTLSSSAQGFEQETRDVSHHSSHGKEVSPPVLNKVPSPTTSSSLPTTSSSSSFKHGAIHYHYHYNSHKSKRPFSTMFKRSYHFLNKDQQVTSDLNVKSETTPTVTFSSPTSSPSSSSPSSSFEPESITNTTTVNPYDQLEKHASMVFDRLKSTDIRSLNRRLKRAFDMMELSSMSNSIIDNILSDILLLEGQFLPWIDPSPQHHTEADCCCQEQKSSSSPSVHATFLSAFFPTLTLLQNMLTEIGQLRMTMNDLQLEYVKKVEEMGQLAEQDVIRKRQEAAVAAAAHVASNHHHHHQQQKNGANGRTALVVWLSNVFHLQASPPSSPMTSTNTIADTTQQQQQQQQQQRSIRYQRSFDSMFTATTREPSKPLVTTTSSGLRIKQKKHDFDCFGPSSSLPRSNSMNEQKRQRRSATCHQTKHPLRPSISAGGPVRKSVASPGIWSSSAPPPPSTLPQAAAPTSTPSPPMTSNDIKTIQRKRSLLGLGGGGLKDHPSLDKLDSGNGSSGSGGSDWNLGTSFGGSWLGT